MTQVKRSYQLISFEYIDDQRIVQFGWARGTPDLALSKKVVSDATFS